MEKISKEQESMVEILEADEWQNLLAEEAKAKGPDEPVHVFAITHQNKLLLCRHGKHGPLCMHLKH